MISNEELNELMDKYNPYPSLRDGQRKAITDIIMHYNSGAKLVECPMPTASGKTLVSYIVTKILINEFGVSKAIISTPLVALVDQFSKNKNYADVPALLGKGNYKCKLDCNRTADNCIHNKNIGKCPLNKGVEETSEKFENACDYYKAKCKFDNSQAGYTTFSRMIVSRMEPEVLIIDESASIESILRQVSEIRLPRDVNQSNICEYLTKYITRLNNSQAKIEIKMKRINEDIKLNKKGAVAKWVNLDKLDKKINSKLFAAQKAARYIKNNIPYIISNDKVEKWNKTLHQKVSKDVKHFKLLTAKEPFRELINGVAFVILMSGTPATHMLTDEPYKVLEVEHPIPKEVRPIFFMRDVGSMSYASRGETSKKMAKKIAEIFQETEHNVIVHCGAYPVADLLYNELKKYVKVQDMLLQTSRSRREDLDRFLGADHMLYLSVKMTEGVDLVGSKFQVNIIAKRPAALWTDQYVQARKVYDEKTVGWNMAYETNTACELMQAYGRTSRTPDDYSITYFMDLAALQFWKRYNSNAKQHKLFYKWFDEAVEII